ncbi:MAG: hypothetical protein R3E40_04100 [Rhodocyclaceae bacterium]
MASSSACGGHHREFAGARLARQHQTVAPVGLDAAGRRASTGETTSTAIPGRPGAGK